MAAGMASAYAELKVVGYDAQTKRWHLKWLTWTGMGMCSFPKRGSAKGFLY
jgi:hypothetical protein